MIDYQQMTDFIRSVYPNRDFIALHEPIFQGNEKKYVLDCIDSTFVSSVGKYVDRFEDMVREYTGANFAIATVNGTAALHMALFLAGVQREDLVITQPLTFIATCNAISYSGAESVFIDIDKNTLGLSTNALENWLSENASVEKSIDGVASKPDSVCIHKQSGRRISACVPMHTFGHPCEIDSIIEICNRYQIKVIEDSAESIGSYFKGKHTGTFGLLGILSFNGNKTITTGGGGMILTNDKELALKAKHLTTQAKKPHPWKFEHDHIGYNYRLPNINAALGCAQMENLTQILKDKRNTANLYKDFFSSIPEIKFITEPEQCISNYWLNAILLKDKEEQERFLKYTNENKVMTRPAWTLMNELPMFSKSPQANLVISKEVESRLVNIPSSVRTI